MGELKEEEIMKPSSVRGVWTLFAVNLAFVLVWGAGARAGDPPAPQNVPGYTVETVSGGGTISGKVVYRGKPVRPRRVAVTQDPAVCGGAKEIYPVEVQGGAVVGAVVWIDDISRGKAFHLPPAVLDQKKCMFVPPIVLMAPGDLKVVNSDDATHNIHIFAHNNRESNQMMAPGQAPIELPLMRPDEIMVRCDIHTWMQGHIVVAKNPYYALSGSGGSFTLTDVPPGKYRVKVWQPALRPEEQEVTVTAGKTTTVNFTTEMK
jgi:plastocyanin